MEHGAHHAVHYGYSAPLVQPQGTYQAQPTFVDTQGRPVYADANGQPIDADGQPIDPALIVPAQSVAPAAVVPPMIYESPHHYDHHDDHH